MIEVPEEELAFRKTNRINTAAGNRRFYFPPNAMATDSVHALFGQTIESLPSV